MGQKETLEDQSGDPSRPGVTGKRKPYNFAVDTRTGESPELLFYRDGEKNSVSSG